MLVGPAGAGKTLALGGLRRAWEAEHGSGSVIGLAPSAAAAEVLAADLGISTENTAKWLYEHDHGRWDLRAGQLVIVDEASLAGTMLLDQLTTHAADVGAKGRPETVVTSVDPDSVLALATRSSSSMLTTSGCGVDPGRPIDSEPSLPAARHAFSRDSSTAGGTARSVERSAVSAQVCQRDRFLVKQDVLILVDADEFRLECGDTAAGPKADQANRRHRLGTTIMVPRLLGLLPPAALASTAGSQCAG